MDRAIFNLSIDIKFCNISYHKKDWTERKTKVDYTTWNVISGTIAIEINGVTLRASKGDVLLFHPGDTYKAWCIENQCSFLVTFFSIDIGNKINLLTTKQTSGLYSSPFISNISNQLCYEYQKNYKILDYPDLNLYAIFLTFFSALSTQFGSQILFTQKPKLQPELRLITLIDSIDNHLEANISVKHMASSIGMSEKYFSGFFNLHIGMSPKQYLTKCRMKYALDLLANTEYTLQEISSKLNYSDQYSFSKAFKLYYGDAPGTFRKHYTRSSFEARKDLK